MHRKINIATIISVYKNDRVNFVKESIKSIFSQKLKSDIYIQEDGIVEVEVHKYLERIFSKGQIKHLGTRAENRGLAYSLNELLNIVLKNNNYKYITRMDADDISAPDRYEKQLEFLEQNPDIDIVGGYVEEFGESLGIIKFPIYHKSMLEYFAKRNPLAHTTVMFHRRFFDKAGLYPIDTIRDEDTSLWLSGFKNGCKFANLPVVLVRVRVNESFLKRRVGVEKVLDDVRNRIRIIRELKLGWTNYVFPLAYLLLMFLPNIINNKIIPSLRYR